MSANSRDPIDGRVKFTERIGHGAREVYLAGSNGHLSPTIYFLRHVALSFKVLVPRVLSAAVPETRNLADGPLYPDPSPP